MAWDNHTKQFVKFGHNKTVAHEQIAASIRQLGTYPYEPSSAVPLMHAVVADGDDYGEDTERWLCYIVFDIIWVVGIPGLVVHAFAIAECVCVCVCRRDHTRRSGLTTTKTSSANHSESQ